MLIDRPEIYNLKLKLDDTFYDNESLWHGYKNKDKLELVMSPSSRTNRNFDYRFGFVNTADNTPRFMIQHDDYSSSRYVGNILYVYYDTFKNTLKFELIRDWDYVDTFIVENKNELIYKALYERDKSPVYYNNDYKMIVKIIHYSYLRFFNEFYKNIEYYYKNNKILNIVKTNSYIIKELMLGVESKEDIANDFYEIFENLFFNRNIPMKKYQKFLKEVGINE